MAKWLYKPVSMLVGILDSIIAGLIFKRVWTMIRPHDDTPKATDAWRGWGQILLAAGLHGAIFALVRAAGERGAAVGARRFTGYWPGAQREQSGQPDETAQAEQGVQPPDGPHSRD